MIAESSFKIENDPKEVKVRAIFDGGRFDSESVFLANKALYIPKFTKGEKRRPLSLSASRRDKITSLIVAHPDNQYLYWNGAPNLSIYAYLYYPADGKMYMQLHIIDDIRKQSEHGKNIYKGDSVQLLLLLPSQKSPWNIGFALNDDDTLESFVWEHPEGANVAAVTDSLNRTLRISRDVKNAKTVYNIQLDLKALGTSSEILAKNGFKMNIIANDNDGEIRESYMSLCGDNPKNIKKMAFHKRRKINILLHFNLI